MASINDAKRICKRIILSNLLTNDYSIAVTPLLSGRHGIGKSQVAKTIAEELGGVCITIEGGTLKEGEITGIPYQYRNDGGNIEFRFLPYYAIQRIQAAEKAINKKSDETDDLISILKGVENRYSADDLTFKEKESLLRSGAVKPVILFFDEINRTDMAVFRELMNIVLTRTVNGYRFPWWVFIIAAMNPSSQDSMYATNEMDPAQLDRFIKLRIQADTAEWLDHAIDHNFDQTIVEFIANHRDALLTSGGGLDDTDNPTPSPRGWNMVDIILKGKGKVDSFFSDSELSYAERDIKSIISAKVGAEAAAMYFSSLKENTRLITAEELFANLKEDISTSLSVKISEQSTARNAVTTKSIIKYMRENAQKLIKTSYWDKVKDRVSAYLELIDDSSKLLFLSSIAATDNEDLFDLMTDILNDDLLEILQQSNLTDILITGNKDG